MIGYVLVRRQGYGLGEVARYFRRAPSTIGAIGTGDSKDGIGREPAAGDGATERDSRDVEVGPLITHSEG